MIETITTILCTGVVVGGSIGAILSGFYKTNKEATKDYSALEHRFEAKIKDLRDELTKDTKGVYNSIKEDFEKLACKIEDMKTHYVSNENFKTYAETMNQLLKMNSDRMERIENTLDDIRDDLNSFIRNSN